MLDNDGKITRRAALGIALGTAGSLAMPSILRAQDRSLKIGVYGGFFETAFGESIFPEFTKASGIAVDSVSVATGASWLVQLEQSAKMNKAPVDVTMSSQVSILLGHATNLWAAIDDKKIKNFADILPQFINKYPDGRIASIGAAVWYMTLVTNTEVYPTAPTSWAALWDPANQDKVGLQSVLAGNFLLEIAATTFFGGTEVLDTDEGIMKTFEKIAELKPNVRLWYQGEAQFGQSVSSGEIPMGQYYHDATAIAAARGEPVRSTFPQEGGVEDSGGWVIPRGSSKIEEAHVFIDFMTQPAMQGVMARKVGAAPILKREKLDLTPEELAAVSSNIKQIRPRYDLYNTKGDWLDQKWTEMITG